MTPCPRLCPLRARLAAAAPGAEVRDRLRWRRGSGEREVHGGDSSTAHAGCGAWAWRARARDAAQAGGKCRVDGGTSKGERPTLQVGRVRSGRRCGTLIHSTA